jgi:hypothetical protein
VLELATHNASDMTIDLYTRTEWNPLCVEVAKLGAHLGAPRKTRGFMVEAAGIEPSRTVSAKTEPRRMVDYQAASTCSSSRN